MTKDHQPPTREDFDAVVSQRDHYRAEALRWERDFLRHTVMSCVSHGCDCCEDLCPPCDDGCEWCEGDRARIAAIDEELAGLTRDQEDSK